MIVLRATHRARKFFDVQYSTSESAGTAVLGEWYVNIVPTVGGDLVLFVNSASLVSVAVPSAVADPFSHFGLRVANLLEMLNAPASGIDRELRHYSHLSVRKTISRSILGCMNDIALRYQLIAEDCAPGATLSLSDAELELAGMPMALLHYSSPREAVLRILAGFPHVPPNQALQRTRGN